MIFLQLRCVCGTFFRERGISAVFYVLELSIPRVLAFLGSLVWLSLCKANFGNILEMFRITWPFPLCPGPQSNPSICRLIFILPHI